MNARLFTCCALLASGCFQPTGSGPAFDAGTVNVCLPACGENEVCVDGACLPRTCERVRCLTGSTCVRGRCYPTTCGATDCPAGQVCDGHLCVEASCAGVTCPFGTCNGGACPACSQLEYFEADAGACTLKKSVGAPCASAGQCGLGFCVGGTCCDRPCAESCEQCDTGTCAFRAPLDPGAAPQCFPGRCSGRSRQCNSACEGDSDCALGAFCDPQHTCVPVLDNGKTCSRAAQCDAGFCSGGVCCNSACQDPCGSCLGESSGAKPFDAGFCHTVTSEVISLVCVGYRCSPSSVRCPQGCGADGECAPNFFCSSVDGGCAKLLLQAEACTRNGECASGNCRNGRCCQANCTNPCSDCLVDGTCQNKADGVADAGCADAGICAQGVCCNKACGGECERCDQPQSPGVCTGVPGPPFACNGYFYCRGDAGCATTCATPRQCSNAGYCTPAKVCVAPCDSTTCAGVNPLFCCSPLNICRMPTALDPICVDF